MLQFLIGNYVLFTIDSRLTNVCQRPRPTLRPGLDRWDIDRGEIEIDTSFAKSGNFGMVNKVGRVVDCPIDLRKRT